jgi:hypothetical protein
MGKFDRRSRDQKRKAQLKKRAERSRKHESLAYHGRKYQTDEYVGIIHATEVGIHESDVMSDRTLTDDAVEAALEALIVRIRQRALPPLEEAGAAGSGSEAADDLIVLNIRRNWMRYAETKQLPRREDLVGVLRTILGSLENWRAERMHSRGYLEFVEGFLKQTGVSVRKLAPEDEVYLDGDDEMEDRLLELGREWIESEDDDTAVAFNEEINEALADGEAEYVLEVCEQLVGESTHKPAATVVFHASAMRAQGMLNRQIESSERD